MTAGLTRSAHNEGDSQSCQNRLARIRRLFTASIIPFLLVACGGDDQNGGGITTINPSPTPTPTATSTSVVATPASAELLAALNAALDDERKAEATYLAVIEKIGPAAPFPNILDAERLHAQMVIEIFEARDLDVPENSWVGKGVAEDTLIANCLIGVDGEIENIAMYDRLLETLAPEDDDARLVFLALQQASRDHHLPAFKQCAGVL